MHAIKLGDKIISADAVCGACTHAWGVHARAELHPCLSPHCGCKEFTLPARVRRQADRCMCKHPFVEHKSATPNICVHAGAPIGYDGCDCKGFVRRKKADVLAAMAAEAAAKKNAAGAPARTPPIGVNTAPVTPAAPVPAQAPMQVMPAAQAPTTFAQRLRMLGPCQACGHKAASHHDPLTAHHFIGACRAGRTNPPACRCRLYVAPQAAPQAVVGTP